MTTPEDKDKLNALLKRIRDNDLDALGELLRIKSPAIKKIAYEIIRDSSVCDDIVNEVMISVIRNVHKFKNFRNINGWINSVTINKSIDYNRRKSHEVPAFSDFISDVAAADENGKLVEKLAVVSALEKMDPTERGILLDKFLNEMTLYALAQKYDLSVKQTRNRLSAAKKHFENFYSG